MSLISAFLPKYDLVTIKNANYLAIGFGASSFDEDFIVSFLKKSSLVRMDYFGDAFGLDYPKRTYRFEVQYRIYSSYYNTCVHILKNLKFFEGFSITASFAKFFPGAVWYEREIWDMFGIFFTDHPDLRRILTDYGFDGFPLRKDFPLSGYSQVRFDEVTRKIVSEPVEFSQEFRFFDFLTPWARAELFF